LRVVVTGGAGFLGAHVVRALIHEGHEPVVVDRLDHGRSAWLPAAVPLIADDVRHWESAAQAVGTAEVVIHLAAQASVPAGERDPVRHVEDNVTGTAAALRLADAVEARGFRFASTAAVYGDPGAALPLREDAPLRPLSVYGIAKRAGEDLVAHWARTRGRAAVVLRPANIYGPGQSAGGEGGVVARFCERLARGAPLGRYGDGEQTRDFIYVGDAARAFVHRLDSLDPGLLVLNLGTGRATTVNRLGACLGDIAGRPVTWEDLPPRAGDIRDSVFDVGALTTWGFVPATSLTAGLSATWEAWTA
jgi:UDP-glucose 4-epimerase